MRRTISAVAVITLLLASALGLAETKGRWASAKYQPIAGFLGPEATLSLWFKQYVDTTSGDVGFKDFLMKLSNSDVLSERNRRAGLEHNQLYSPILTLLEKDMRNFERMDTHEKAEVRMAILELDIALAVIDATLPKSAHEEFRREILRGAKPLREVAMRPTSAIGAMALTLSERKVTERINQPVPEPPAEGPRLTAPEIRNP